jgi:hypothetical protein
MVEHYRQNMNIYSEKNIIAIGYVVILGFSYPVECDGRLPVRSHENRVVWLLFSAIVVSY